MEELCQNLLCAFVYAGKLRPVGQIWPVGLPNRVRQTLVQGLLQIDVNPSVS